MRWTSLLVGRGDGLRGRPPCRRSATATLSRSTSSVPGHGDQQPDARPWPAARGRSTRVVRGVSAGDGAGTGRAPAMPRSSAGDAAGRAADACGHRKSIVAKSRGSTVTLLCGIFSRNLGRSPVAFRLPERAALGVETGGVVEQEDVLEGDDVALHPLHLGDVRDPAGAVLEPGLVHDQVDGRGHLLADGADRQVHAGHQHHASRGGSRCRAGRWSGRCRSSRRDRCSWPAACRGRRRHGPRRR